MGLEVEGLSENDRKSRLFGRERVGVAWGCVAAVDATSWSIAFSVVPNSLTPHCIHIPAASLQVYYTASPMSFVPGPSATRGGIMVQPTYFTSSLYVDSCREDIEMLIQEFSQKYDENRDRSFSLFKSIWISSGWQWIHFKVLDPYARDPFLRVTIRLFVGGSLGPRTLDVGQ